MCGNIDRKEAQASVAKVELPKDIDHMIEKAARWYQRGITYQILKKTNPSG